MIIDNVRENSSGSWTGSAGRTETLRKVQPEAAAAAPVKTASEADSEQQGISSTAEAEATNGQESPELKEEDIADLSEKMNDFMQELNTDIRFEYHEKLGRLYMSVVDRKNDEVIKSFPPEKMIKVLETLHDWVGLILDKKV